MEKITSELIQKVKQVPIENFLPSRFKVSNGKKFYLCPLPGHQEKKPSFVLYPSNTYKCYGCLRVGDSIQFILDLMGWDKHNKEEFIEAVNYLKKYI